MNITYKIEERFGNSRDISDYVTNVDVSIKADSGNIIGIIKVSVVDSYYLKKNEECYLDDISQELGEVESILSEGILDDNFLYINSILIKKEFRGYNIGANLFYNTMCLLNHLLYRHVILYPFPLQHSNDMEDDFSDLPNDQNSLIKMYKKWGFKRYKRSKYFYMELDTHFFEKRELLSHKLPEDKEEELDDLLTERLKGNK